MQSTVYIGSVDPEMSVKETQREGLEVDVGLVLE